MMEKMPESGTRGLNIVLASASERRRQLLSQIGISHTVFPSKGEEKVSGSTPEETAMALSLQKAEDIFDRLVKQCFDGEDTRRPLAVIGADTIVCLDGRLLGKPKDEEEAFLMLSALQGRTHQVYTGVTVLYDGCPGQDNRVHTDGPDCRPTGKIQFYECTEVSFYPVSEEEIKAYIAGGEPMDKAGAYGIQGTAAAFIKGICGDYNNVVGLPAGRLYQEMKAKGLF